MGRDVIGEKTNGIKPNIKQDSPKKKKDFKKTLIDVKQYADDTFCEDRVCEGCGGCAEGNEFFEIEKINGFVFISYTNKKAGISRMVSLMEEDLYDKSNEI